MRTVTDTDCHRCPQPYAYANLYSDSNAHCYDRSQPNSDPYRDCNGSGEPDAYAYPDSLCPRVRGGRSALNGSAAAARA